MIKLRRDTVTTMASIRPETVSTAVHDKPYNA